MSERKSINAFTYGWRNQLLQEPTIMVNTTTTTNNNNNNKTKQNKKNNNNKSA